MIERHLCAIFSLHRSRPAYCAVHAYTRPQFALSELILILYLILRYLLIFFSVKLRFAPRIDGQSCTGGHGVPQFLSISLSVPSTYWIALLQPYRATYGLILTMRS
jgi:hypothetical protein